MVTNKMKIITTTGFFNTGSSAITHILKEIESVYVPDNLYEMRLLYDPDCISDLEYNLVENAHRQNSSHALKRFKKYIDFNSNNLLNHHYNKMFRNDFKNISYKYIANLTKFNYYGFSHIDKYDKGKMFWFLDRIYIKIIKTLFLNKRRPKFIKPTLLSSKTLQYGTIYEKKEFYNVTKNYIGELFSLIKNNNEFIAIDQLVPATNVDRYLNYIPDDYQTKVFIVDRDPRDLFVTFKYFNKEKGIPCKKVEDFCEWFALTREQAAKQYDSNKVMRVQFEDLVYDYEKVRKNILTFVGIDTKYVATFKCFNPDKSINNTQVWYRYPQAKKEIEYIESNLSDYLFDFEKFTKKPNFKKGNMFDC